MNDFAKTAFSLAGIWSAGAAAMFCAHTGLEMAMATIDLSNTANNISSTFSGFFKNTANGFFAISGGFGLMGAASCTLPKKVQRRLDFNG